MKRNHIALLLALTVLAALLLTGCGSKETEGLIFQQSEGSYIVTGYQGQEVHVVIPAVHNDVPVTQIAEAAFANTDIQSVVLGKNIQVIQKDAFENCSLLKDVQLNEGLQLLDAGCFRSCCSLTEFEVPASVQKISWAFSQCTGLKKVTFASGSQLDVLIGAFYRCSSLNQVELPDHPLNFQGDNFEECTALRSLSIPSGSVFGVKPEFTDVPYTCQVDFADSMEEIFNNSLERGFMTSVQATNYKDMTGQTLTPEIWFTQSLFAESEAIYQLP